MSDANGSTRTPLEPVRNLSDEEKVAEVRDLVYNISFLRGRMISQLLDPRRNIDAECGYVVEPTVENYQRMYDRFDVAARVVECVPKESWQNDPVIYEDEDPDTDTAFEQSLTDLDRMLLGQDSSFEPTEDSGSPLLSVIKQADEVSGIGHFGIILIGFNDGLPLDMPAFGMDTKDIVSQGAGTDQQYYEFLGQQVTELLRTPRTPAPGNTVTPAVVFMRVFPESLVQITQYEANIFNPRYGQPVQYLVTMNDPRQMTTGGIGLSYNTFKVHWTRVIHVHDNRNLPSPTHGYPRMKQVFDRLCDLKKLYGGSAEMYWRGALPGYSVESNNPMTQQEGGYDEQKLKDMLENHQQGLQRWLVLLGFSVKSLSPQVVDPEKQIDAHITAICIRLGIPKRVFMGTERGHLASGQDDETWNDRLRLRRRDYITPYLLVPMIDRLIWFGVLVKPVTGYKIHWPDISNPTEAQKADIGLKKTQALVQWSSGNAPQYVPLAEFLSYYQGASDDEVEQITEASAQTIAEDHLDQLDMQLSGQQQPGPNGASSAGQGGSPAGQGQQLQGAGQSTQGGV